MPDAAPGPLDEYRARRDFGATPEPAPGAVAPADRPQFTIQRHSARALHFDLRLEVDGALASWAVPKGLPLREGPKRLAVRTEDHPLEYLTFSAVIPEGQYGAGRMTVWDTGTWTELERTDDEWKLVLEGSILRGEYHMVRTGDRRGREEWLVFRSGKGPPGPEDPARRFREARPMLATSVEHPFDDPAWAFELKWDGYRALALTTSEGTELQSRRRRRHDITAQYPALADLRRLLLCQECVLDGEIVVLDGEGASDFGALQRGDGEVCFVAFDLLHVDGEWIDELPWSERRARLAEVVAPEGPPRLRLSDHVAGAGTGLFALAAERGLEGIVAKRMDAPYRIGRRSDDWRKIKARHEMTAVIGGFTEGARSRRGTVGALLVGERGEDGALRYLSHVGSGLTDELARALWERLRAIEQPESPFANPVPDAPAAPRWVRPELRCEVRFVERTTDEHLRAPVFRGLVEEAEADEGPDVPGGPFGSGAEAHLVQEQGREVSLTNLTKPYWPDEGITKGNLLDHYLRMAPVLVPHLAGRPMIMKRYPDGIAGDSFFQHTVTGGPEWLRYADLSRGGKPDEKVSHYAIVDDPLGLLWLVNLGNIDLNPWQSTADAPDEPTHVLFDLDPADGLPFDRVVEAATLVRRALDDLGLRGYPRTSGATGMHILVPVLPGLDFEAVKRFAGAVSDGLVAVRPDLVTTVRRVRDRGPRVYLDHNQNGRGRSIASVYSVRPRPGAPVATPLRWDEVVPGLDPRDMTMGVVARRVEREGDLARGLLDDRQDLSGALARIGAA